MAYKGSFIITTASPSLTKIWDEPQPKPAQSYNKLYANLKALVKEQGLLKRQPRYYAYAFAEPLIGLAASVTFLLLVESFWLQLLNAMFLSLVFVRMGFVMHDAGHRQIFTKPRPNDFAGLIYANLLLGSSISGWRIRHNLHHASTNELGVDPTLEIPVWAWIEDQMENQSELFQFIMKYQAYTFFPILSLSAFFQSIAAFRDVLFSPKVQDRVVQAIFLVVHYVLYFGLLFTALPWWQATIFFLFQFLFTGLHLGLSFAPNHKGMPIVDPNHGMDFLYVQLITTRNVRPSLLTDYLYGCLNYQVEHHLFPGMPRNNLGKARVIVKAFCEKHEIPYYETGVVQSYREILDYMHEVGAPVRDAN